MSGVIDTNILIYAINTASPWHTPALHFLTTALRAEACYLCTPILYEFLRVSTHARIFPHALSWEDAWAFLQQLLAQEQVSLLHEADEHLTTLHSVLMNLQRPQGNFLHDCHIASIMKENGVKRIYTRDTDFRRFAFLEVVDPIA